MSRAIKYLLNSGLSRGWGAWLEMAAMEHELVQMLRKGLSFILFHKEAPAFAGWRHFVVVKKDAERGWGMIGRALKYLKHHELARCLNAWRSTFAEETRKEGSLRRALGHFVHRELSVGWSTWAAEAAEGVRLGELLYNCLRTIVLQRESLALRGWKHAHRQRVRKLNAMAHAFRHLRNQKLSAGWGTWVAKTARRGGAMHQLLSRSMHFLLNHELSRCGTSGSPRGPSSSASVPPSAAASATSSSASARAAGTRGPLARTRQGRRFASCAAA